MSAKPEPTCPYCGWPQSAHTFLASAPVDRTCEKIARRAWEMETRRTKGGPE